MLTSRESSEFTWQLGLVYVALLAILKFWRLYRAPGEQLRETWLVSLEACQIGLGAAGWHFPWLVGRSVASLAVTVAWLVCALTGLVIELEGALFTTESHVVKS